MRGPGALALAALVLAAPAFAQERLPDCLSPEGHDTFDIGALGHGFVVYSELAAEDATTAVLEHCPTARRLVLMRPDAADPAGAQAEMDLFRAMVMGDDPFTMEQMRDALGGMGADAEIASGGESCACAALAGRGG